MRRAAFTASTLAHALALAWFVHKTPAPAAPVGEHETATSFAFEGTVVAIETRGPSAAETQPPVPNHASDRLSLSEFPLKPESGPRTQRPSAAPQMRVGSGQRSVVRDPVATAENERAGAPATLLGTTPLRAILIAISADAAWQTEALGVHRVRYALGAQGEVPRTTVTHVEGGSDRFAHLIEGFLTQAAQRELPPLSGTLELRVTGDGPGEHVFTIRCDERAREGYVQFTDGRRVTVRERSGP
jgi:hypothetical protein